MDPLKRKKLVVIGAIVVGVVILAIIGIVAFMKYKAGKAPVTGPSSVAQSGPGSSTWESDCIHTSDLKTAEASPSMVCSLNLFNQGLTEIPSSVFQMKNLEYLNLSDNAITTVPPDIGNLTHLKWLYLNQTKITDLPDTITNLSDLQFFTIEWDGVKTIPTNFSSMKSLQVVILKGNPLQEEDVTKVKADLAKAGVIF